jgi:glycosyltransferase involved in cell wall biosynthesis
MKVLLLAYACSPFMGSEPATGWNGAVQTARYFDTWVICREHTFREQIETYCRERGGVAGLHFCFVPISPLEQLLDHIPGLFYWGYRRWHRRAFREARRLHEQERFDVVHQLNMCGFREPGYLWKLGIPFIWGPVGGTQNYPWRFLWSGGPVCALQEAFRTVVSRMQLRFSRRVGQAARAAALVMCANSDGVRDFERVHKIKPLLMVEVGTNDTFAALRGIRGDDHPLKILWIGNFEHRKALHLLLCALGKLRGSVPFELRILGMGRNWKRWHKIAEREGVAPHCAWMGRVPHEEVPSHYRWADLFVFTSIRDTTGTVVLEALSQGVPVICADHQGVGDMVTPNCGVKIPVTSPGEFVENMSRVINGLALDRAKLNRLSEGAVARSKEYSWSLKGERMAVLYRQVMSDAGPLPR